MTIPLREPFDPAFSSQEATEGLTKVSPRGSVSV